jgi:plasmid maintenance system antidote protein VapI
MFEKPSVDPQQLYLQRQFEVFNAELDKILAHLDVIDGNIRVLIEGQNAATSDMVERLRIILDEIHELQDGMQEVQEAQLEADFRQTEIQCKGLANGNCYDRTTLFR